MKNLLIAAMLFSAVFSGAAEYKFEFKSSKPWKLKIGESTTFSALLLTRNSSKEKFQPAKGVKVGYRLTDDGNKMISGTFTADGKAFTVSGKLKNPGWIYANFHMLDSKGKVFRYKNRGRMIAVSGGIGALAEPEKLLPGMKEPADFDAFWKAQRAKLDKIPVKAKLTQVPAAKKWQNKYKVYDVKIDCAGPMPVSGYLSVPVNAKPKSLPAFVRYHGAGVYSSAKIYKASPALILDINAHGILNGQPGKYYSDLYKTTLKNYFRANYKDREKIYFNGMYLRVMRALDYIKSRPEWNGKILIVAGSSQGGGQAIAAAALDQQVTLCLAAVPAMSDHSGSTAKPPRMPGWPRFYDARYSKKVDQEAVAATAYYDNVFFARRIKCEAWLTAGLIDTVCSPAGIHVVYNNLRSAKKYINIFPTGFHNGAPNHKGNRRADQILKTGK